MDIAWVGMTWLHAVGMVALLGYYGIVAAVVLPVLSRSMSGEPLGRTVAAMGRRSRPLVALAVVLFLVSGVYLLVSAGRYDGAGNLFASTWTTLLTVKHLVVLVMVAVGVAIDRLAAAAGEASTDESRRTMLGTLGLACEGMTALGVLVLLLTAAAQAS
jgi:uncharacterized membrane protein